MNDFLKRIANYFLIGVFAFIPIVVVLQIVLFYERVYIWHVSVCLWLLG